MSRLLDTPILFFGGKGGVGKTTLAAAYAVLSAEAGVRTLLVSTDPAHSTADALDHPLGPTPREVLPALWAMEIDPAVEADIYIRQVKERIRQAASPRLLQEVEREVDAARVSPGAEEAALFDRFADLMQLAGRDYERVIFDTAPTGHTLRLLSLPELMGTWIDSLVARRRKLTALGRMWRNVAGAAAGSGEEEQRDPVLAALEERQTRFQRAREIIHDEQRARFVFVLVPERLPILETDKAVTILQRYGIPVGGIIVNRVLPETAEGAFLARRREQEQTYLEEIDQRFASYYRFRVPLLETDIQGLDNLRSVIGTLPVTERVST